MATASNKIKCKYCPKELAKSFMYKHEAKVHQIYGEIKGPQEWCPTCSVWHAHKARRNHFKRWHNGEEVVSLSEAQVRKPGEGDPADFRRRGIKRQKTNHQCSDTDANDFASNQSTGPEGSSTSPEPTTSSEPTTLSEPTTSPEPSTSSESDGPREYGIPLSMILDNPIERYAARNTVQEQGIRSHNPIEQYAERRTVKEREVSSQMLAKARAMIQARQEEVENAGKSSRRGRKRGPQKPPVRTFYEEYLPDYARIWEDLVRPNLISYNDYIDFEQSESTGADPLDRYTVIVCTNDEARTLLIRRTLPRYPILVPASGKTMLTISKYLEGLKGKHQVDVQALDRIPLKKEDGAGNKAKPCTGKDAVEMFQTPGRLLNFLNLDSDRDDPVPECISNIPNYSILAKLVEDAVAGKKTTHYIRDLSNCARFQVLTRAGVWSFAHFDHYGKFTTIFVEEGEKAWLLWPQLSPEEKAEFARRVIEDVSMTPVLAPMFLHLGPGDLLLQPPVTLHAPYTITDCLMSGTQHFHAPSMHIHVQAANFDRAFPNTTNEDEAFEAMCKFERIKREMETGGTLYDWPIGDDAATFETELTKYREGFQGVFCDCKNGCLVDRRKVNAGEECPCRKIGLSCDDRCHQEQVEVGMPKSKPCRNCEH